MFYTTRRVGFVGDGTTYLVYEILKLSEIILQRETVRYSIRFLPSEC